MKLIDYEFDSILKDYNQIVNDQLVFEKQIEKSIHNYFKKACIAICKFYPQIKSIGFRFEDSEYNHSIIISTSTDNMVGKLQVIDTMEELGRSELTNDEEETLIKLISPGFINLCKKTINQRLVYFVDVDKVMPYCA